MERHTRQGEPRGAVLQLRGTDEYEPTDYEPRPRLRRRGTYRHLTVIAGDGPLVHPDLACHCTGLVHRHEPPFCPGSPVGAAA